jgi:hypothetical protein
MCVVARCFDGCCITNKTPEPLLPFWTTIAPLRGIHSNDFGMIDSGNPTTQPGPKGTNLSPGEGIPDGHKKISTPSNFQLFSQVTSDYIVYYQFDCFQQLLQEHCHELFPGRSLKAIKSFASASWKELEKDQKNVINVVNI